jgi:hypothetical protein
MVSQNQGISKHDSPVMEKGTHAVTGREVYGLETA